MSFLFIFFVWRRGDWRNWTKYYPTVLFMIVISLLENVITTNHHLWMMINSPSNTSTLANSLYVTFTTFPATVLLYLSNYPQKNHHKVCYMLLWVLIYSVLEYGFGLLEFYSYANGWSLGWSIIFNCFMFPILQLHHKNSLLAWLCSGIIILFIWFHFGFSFEVLKDTP
ncbi:MAG: hypothetical protein ACD_26C00049G0001 [uncultured bacterium]|nr:MAG: hypothetical protein ACD_26C00049G0001 [uncultured bacterium]